MRKAFANGSFLAHASKTQKQQSEYCYSTNNVLRDTPRQCECKKFQLLGEFKLLVSLQFFRQKPWFDNAVRFDNGYTFSHPKCHICF